MLDFSIFFRVLDVMRKTAQCKDCEERDALNDGLSKDI